MGELGSGEVERDLLLEQVVERAQSERTDYDVS